MRLGGVILYGVLFVNGACLGDASLKLNQVFNVLLWGRPGQLLMKKLPASFDNVAVGFVELGLRKLHIVEINALKGACSEVFLLKTYFYSSISLILTKM